MLRERSSGAVLHRPVRAASLAVLLLLVLAALTLAVRTTPLPLDSEALSWVLHHRAGWLTTVAIAITATGSGVPAYLLAAVAGIVAVPSRWWIGVIACEAALLAGQGIRLALAASVHRPRPSTVYWAAYASGASFPSGHTTTSALVAALLCTAVSLRLGAGRTPRVLQVVALLWAFAVGLTRIYLGVHWATDVLGGWLLAAFLCLVAYLANLVVGARGVVQRQLAGARSPRPLHHVDPPHEDGRG